MHNKDSVKIEIATVPKVSEIEIVKKPNLPVRCDRYENCSWPYVLSLPFMWLITIYVMIKKWVYKILGLGLPKTNSIFFDGLGKESRKVKDYATTWRAMDIVYNHPFTQKWTFRGAIDEFYWFGLNCQGLRNRLKLIKDELRKAILKVDDGGEIRLVSLACGSAESVIEIIAEAKAKNKIIKAKFVDIDGDALERAKNLAKHYGVENQIEMHKGSIYDVIESSREFKPQIVEMMGFLDYISQEEAISLLTKIRSILELNGYLITCNICPNIEQHFLKWVINWPMVYRNPKDLSDIAEKSGFKDYRLIYEPLKVHELLIAKKN
ncbi:MAG TPA: class I SAM-dependent methyltransferase family protein [Candidatus Pacearchaeota archaeon]|nr:class I SAM-dependent methyltransferase family protein [Candidatus Pacearchaeota archaeon]HPR80170.1 class I SAM-dependent methyltransferase family protein [Candidatus Pacearchaeota archaeon]